MSVISAIGEQWNKAEFAHQLALQLSQKQGVAALFGGATSLTTVCNLIAGMHFQVLNEGCTGEPCQAHQIPLTHSHLISVLHGCFRLLFIKEVQSGGLTQAEQLILALAKLIAAETVRKIARESMNESVDDTAKLRCQQMITFSEQLQSLNSQRRRANRNMI